MMIVWEAEARGARIERIEGSVGAVSRLADGLGVACTQLPLAGTEYNGGYVMFEFAMLAQERLSRMRLVSATGN